MNVDTLLINITSEEPEALLAFYRDVAGIPQTAEFGPTSLDAAGTILAFDEHSGTRGRAKEPERYLLSLMVDGFDAFEARLDGAGVPCIRRRGREPWGGVISTYEDPDGNYFQIINFDSDPAAPPAIKECMLALGSEDGERLTAFYRDVVRLPKSAERPDLRVGAGSLSAPPHDGVHGAAKEPSRWLVDFWVSDLDAQEERLVAAGLTPIRSKGKEFWGGVFSTFQDPDGNYFQLVEYHPELATEGGE